MSVLNALLGGLGRGATAWGERTWQEQERRRQEQAAEQMRLRQAEEQGNQRRLLQQDKLDDLSRQRQEGATVARLLGVELPDDAQLTSDGVRLLLEDRRQKGMDSRLETNLSGRMEQIQAQLKAMEDRNAAAAEASRAAAAAATARARRDDRTDPNIRGTGGRPADPARDVQQWIIGRVDDLMKPQRDDMGFLVPGLSAAEAKRRAEEDAAAVFGSGQPAGSRSGASSLAPSQPGGGFLQGIGVRPPLESFFRR